MDGGAHRVKWWGTVKILGFRLVQGLRVQKTGTTKAHS